MNIAKEVAALDRLTVGQLRERYADAFGEATRTANKSWLVKRIAWRLQANAEGGLSDRAKRRAAELANEADLRLSSPKSPTSTTRTVVVDAPTATSGRLPPPGTVLERDYKGRRVRVTVRADGFEYDGEVYRSLSAVAKAITGSHVNGFHFFRLNGGDKG